MGVDRTVRLTAAQAIVCYLQRQFSERDGVERRLVAGMLGIFGHGNVHGLAQALDEFGDELQFFQGRNEQSMVHTAAAYAKATRRKATLAVTSSIGPGATNMITGAAGATINRLPVLLFPGDVYATRHQGPVLQQLESPAAGDVSVNDCFRPISRYFDRITRPEQLLTALPEAMRVLTSPSETGAVVIALPQDIQSHAFEYPEQFFQRRTWRIERPQPARDAIAEAASRLARSARPLVIAGGGVLYSEAERELLEFARRLAIPVAETFAGKGAVQVNEWFTVGGLGLEGTFAANEIARNADLVLCIGTRMTDFATGSQSLFACPDVRFISINVDGRDAHKQGALSVIGDARESLKLLAETADPISRPEYERFIRGRRGGWLELREQQRKPVDGEAMSQGQLILALNDAAKPGDTIVAAAGTPPGDLQKIWDATGDRHCHIEFGFSCMGYELPAGVGVRLAQTEGEVIVYLGDGTFLLNPGELVTPLQHGLKITVVISENHGFQSIRRLQMARAGRPFGNEFRTRNKDGRLEGDYIELDLARAAEGLGAFARRVRTPDELREALAEAGESSKSAVIVCETEPHRYLPGGDVWWDVAPAEVSRFEEVATLRAAYDRDRDRRQRFHY